MSATADSSCGELSGALQRNAKHEARPFKHRWLLHERCEKPSEILRFAQNDS